MKAPRSASKTQAPAAARDGFVTYDELRGPDLDAARWSPARLPLPTGGEHIPLDPNAELAVGEGEVRVTIPRFSLSHDRFQSADSAKYLTFSTRQFELPPDRPATFAVDLAVKNIGGEPEDFRRGLAAFHVFELDVSKRAFSACGTSTQLVNEWKDPQYPSRPMTNVLVMRMAHDEATRRMWEDRMVVELERHGVTATPSYRLYPSTLPEDKQTVIDDVKRSNFDGVILAVSLPTQTRSEYVPGYVATRPVTVYNPWWDAYSVYYHDYYHAGYVETERVVRQRSEVWSVEGDDSHLVWTATSETFDPSSSTAVTREIAKKIVPELLEQRIIADQGRASNQR